MDITLQKYSGKDKCRAQRMRDQTNAYHIIITWITLIRVIIAIKMGWIIHCQTDTETNTNTHTHHHHHHNHPCTILFFTY